MSPKQLTEEDYYKLINYIFAETDEGKKLLEIWTELFMFRKTAIEGDDLLTIGLKQGEQGFVLSIHNLVNTWNQNTNQEDTK